MFFEFFFMQMLAYGLATWNFRALAFANYLHTGVSDTAIAALNFLVIKKVGEAKDRSAFLGYVIGGPIGSLLSIYITKILFGH